MKRKITIIYDPETCVEDEDNYDLFEQIVDTLDNAGIVVGMEEVIYLDD